MLRSDFNFELPEELIALYPSARRSGCRLLCLDGDGGELRDRRFDDLRELLEPGDLLVFNDTRVIPARLYGTKESGGAVELLLERLLPPASALVHARASKPPRAGTLIRIEGGGELRVTGRDGDLFTVETADGGPLAELLEERGHIPLPPYIRRPDEELDRERYQTVYARVPGAVAAPTAGLHFDEELLGDLRDRGVRSAFVTLHVGAGTFQPVREEDITEHRMHSEFASLSAETARAVSETRAAGRRVIAVGTTAVRTLESAALAAGGDGIAPFRGETAIFIYPGYRYRLVDCLITNFHLPQSTLIMLVCAFAGFRETMDAYRHAVRERYRFFSYGDCMFISRNPQAASSLPPSARGEAHAV